MIIKFSPVFTFSEKNLTVRKQGDALIINDDVYNFGELPEGAVLPASAVDCEYVIGDVTRRNGELIITLLLPHSVDASDHAKFPADIVSPPDGTVSLPQ